MRLYTDGGAKPINCECMSHHLAFEVQYVQTIDMTYAADLTSQCHIARSRHVCYWMKKIRRYINPLLVN